MTVWVICEHNRCKSWDLIVIVWLKSFAFDWNNSHRRINCWEFRDDDDRSILSIFIWESCWVERCCISLWSSWLLVSLSYDKQKS